MLNEQQRRAVLELARQVRDSSKAINDLMDCMTGVKPKSEIGNIAADANETVIRNAIALADLVLAGIDLSQETNSESGQ